MDTEGCGLNIQQPKPGRAFKNLPPNPMHQPPMEVSYIQTLYTFIVIQIQFIQITILIKNYYLNYTSILYFIHHFHINNTKCMFNFTYSFPPYLFFHIFIFHIYFSIYCIHFSIYSIIFHIYFSVAILYCTSVLYLKYLLQFASFLSPNINK